MERTFNIIIERDRDGVLVATSPTLRGCHAQARTMDELLERVRAVIVLCLEADDEPADMEFVGIQRVKVSL